jgi:hypothetical protein
VKFLGGKTVLCTKRVYMEHDMYLIKTYSLTN